MINPKNFTMTMELLDRALGFGLDGLEKAGIEEPVSSATYKVVQKTLAASFKFFNDLEILGEENVPTDGGVILASNHQSWLDASVLVAACPRRVHFIAKSEFRQWPLMRQLLRFTDSLYIRRGGDVKGLAEIANKICDERAVAIFPEGTIPGEEDTPRRKVIPFTGLLTGRTGAVRLALMAKVPIVPVGVSGTGRALPPEIYPRKEMIRLPAGTPVSIRFGEPYYLEKYEYEEINRKILRTLTDNLMERISVLVNHSSNYAPINVPPVMPVKAGKIGVLLLHGFTSHTSAISGIIPRLEKAKIPYMMPVLRGHGTRYQDLNGVCAKDWYVDAERALIDLWDRVDKVVVVGFSMGGLVALDLATRHPGKIAGIVTAAACLKFTDPLARFSRSLSTAVKYWSSPCSFNDKNLVKKCKNYTKFPVATFASLYEYSREIDSKLGEVHVPIRILQSKADGTVSPIAANILLEKVASKRREIVWYEQSGHEMFLDVEAHKAINDTMEFIETF